MGTNYYAKEKDSYDEESEGLHIGKWNIREHFTLCVHPSLHLNNLEDWLNYLKDKTIFAEAGYEVTIEELLNDFNQPPPLNYHPGRNAHKCKGYYYYKEERDFS